MSEVDTIITSNSNISTSKIRRSPVWLYYLIQMMQSFGQNLSYQYFPIYVRKLGATESQMGLMTATQNVTSTFFQPFWGRASDRLGRKRFLILGFFIAGVTAILLGFSRTPTDAIIIIAINGLGISIVAPSWAGSIADYTESGKRAGFIGRMNSVAYSYVAVMFLLVSLISFTSTIEELVQFRIIVVLSGINILLAMMFAFFLIDLRSQKTKEFQMGLFEALKDKMFVKFLSVMFVWWLTMSFAWSFFPIVMNDVVHATAWQIALLTFSATIVQAYSSNKWGNITDKIGPKKAAAIGLSTFMFIPLGFALAKEWWHLFFPQLISGFGIGGGFTALQAYLLDIAGEEKAGYYSGTYQILWGIITFFGSLSGGIVLQYYKAQVGLIQAVTTLLLIIAGLRLLASLLFLKLPDSRERTSNPLK